MSRNNRVTNNDVFSGLGKIGRRSNNIEKGEALEEARSLPIEQVEPNPDQPRKTPNEQKDNELAEDIGQRGILQPIIVRPLPDGTDGKFQIIAGERRWRAARQAGLEVVPVIIREDLDDQEVKLISLVENLQRVDLEPQDEAEFFKRLVSDYNFSNRKIAQMINRSPGYVNERMKLVGMAEAETTASAMAKATPNTLPESVVRERLNQPASKAWRYRPQNFERFRVYITETVQNYEQLKNEAERESLLSEVSQLKEELAKLEQKLKPKGARSRG